MNDIVCKNCKKIHTEIQCASCGHWSLLNEAEYPPIKIGQLYKYTDPEWGDERLIVAPICKEAVEGWCAVDPKNPKVCCCHASITLLNHGLKTVLLKDVENNKEMTGPVTPLLTVDIVVFSSSTIPEVLLIERRDEPHGWALPGGFVEVGETVGQAASRELKEETSLDWEFTKGDEIGVYSDPNRDLRGHTVSVAYMGVLEPMDKFVAGDDAKNAKLFKITQLPTVCFDHREIIEDALKAFFQTFSIT